MRALNRKDFSEAWLGPVTNEMTSDKIGIDTNNLPDFPPVKDTDPVIRRLYSAALDFEPHPAKPSRRYMVASSPRSGSTDFCLRLWRTGQLGAPMEYPNLFTSAEMVRRLGGGDPMAYWERLQAVRTSPNGVFGFKMFLPLYRVLEGVAPGLLPHLRCDVVIHLRREDWIGQALSYVRATQTHSWFSDVEERQPPIYDFEQVVRAARWIRRQDSEWEQIFRKTGTAPIRVSHEEALASFNDVVARLAEGLNQDGRRAGELPVPSLARQSDATSAVWRERFFADCQRLGGQPDEVVFAA